MLHVLRTWLLRVCRPQLFLRRHHVLFICITIVSIISAIIYELTGAHKPRRPQKLAVHLNAIDLRIDRDQLRTTWRDQDFECVGFHATFGCDPHGLRDVSRDRPCDAPLPRVAGYCLIRNQTSGQLHRVMLTTCTSWRWNLIDTVVTCNDARQFTDYSMQAAAYRHPGPLVLPNTSIDTQLARGIVMVAYPKVIAGVYAIIKVLRQLGCVLPVEIWIDPNEMQTNHSILHHLTDPINGLNCTVQVIQDPRATHFRTKPYAIYHSRFESILFLDSDNLPVRDPTYLFDSEAFQQFSAIFWPDFWRPGSTPEVSYQYSTPFNVHEQSVLWSLLDMPFVDMFEQESGQLLIDRRRSARALEKLLFYALEEPQLLTKWHLVWGDKDWFRLAWLNTSTPFHYIAHAPSLGGLKLPDSQTFCGLAMVQHDPDGRIVFMHRNQVKLDGTSDQRSLVTHIQTFLLPKGVANVHTATKTMLDQYRIECKEKGFGPYSCYAIYPTNPNTPVPMTIRSIQDSVLHPWVEDQAIAYAVEGRSLLSPEEVTALQQAEDSERTKAQEREQKRLVTRQQHQQKVQWFIMAGAILFVLCGGTLKWYIGSQMHQTTGRNGQSLPVEDTGVSSFSCHILLDAPWETEDRIRRKKIQLD